MNLTAEEQKTIRLALHYAGEWQESVIDSYSSTDFNDSYYQNEIKQAKVLKDKFHILLQKLKYTK